MRSVRVAGVVALAVWGAACGSDRPPTGPTPTPAPLVSSVTPSSGPAAGGTAVRIAGANFAAGATVSVGGVLATAVVVESATSITAMTPARAAGVADVAVTVSGRTGALPGAFTYQASNPPSISGITVRGPRANQPANFADVGEEITVTAIVQDADTPEAQLTFQWSADAGTFSGTGASVKWRAPGTAGTARLTLVVSDGTPVTGTANVTVHDSIKEVGDLARLFLLDFSDSRLGPDYVMRNFSTGARCIKERDSEYADVVKNREFYRINSWRIDSASVKVQFNSKACALGPNDGDACAVVPALWNSTCLKTNPECKAGETGNSEGLDHVTAVFEGTEWKLCASYWQSRDGIARPNFIR